MKSIQHVEMEEEKSPSSALNTEKVQRKKYLKKTGKSLWMKSKNNKEQSLSIDVTTCSSDNHNMIKSQQYNQISHLIGLKSNVSKEKLDLSSILFLKTRIKLIK